MQKKICEILQNYSFLYFSWNPSYVREILRIFMKSIKFWEIIAIFMKFYLFSRNPINDYHSNFYEIPHIFVKNYCFSWNLNYFREIIWIFMKLSNYSCPTLRLQKPKKISFNFHISSYIQQHTLQNKNKKLNEMCKKAKIHTCFDSISSVIANEREWNV